MTREESEIWKAAFYRALASNLWLILQERGWSARDLAEKIDMHPRTVQRWLDGKSRMLSSYTGLKIVKATGCRFEDYYPSMDRSTWIARLATRGLGVVDIGRHVGLHPELVHLRLEQHQMEHATRPDRVS
jgi:DNA-binding Xre family transcriptional regulator